jgi:flagellar basal-body rod protein FlgG
VQVVDEMVNMIVAQRAYELNSKAITASDEMLQQANNLRFAQAVCIYYIILFM